jgi:hypothetical protein
MSLKLGTFGTGRTPEMGATLGGCAAVSHVGPPVTNESRPGGPNTMESNPPPAPQCEPVENPGRMVCTQIR